MVWRNVCPSISRCCICFSTLNSLVLPCSNANIVVHSSCLFSPFYSPTPLVSSKLVVCSLLLADFCMILHGGCFGSHGNLSVLLFSAFLFQISFELRLFLCSVLVLLYFCTDEFVTLSPCHFWIAISWLSYKPTFLSSFCCVTCIFPIIGLCFRLWSNLNCACIPSQCKVFRLLHMVIVDVRCVCRTWPHPNKDRKCLNMGTTEMLTSSYGEYLSKKLRWLSLGFSRSFLKR